MPFLIESLLGVITLRLLPLQVAKPRIQSRLLCTFLFYLYTCVFTWLTAYILYFTFPELITEFLDTKVCFIQKLSMPYYFQSEIFSLFLSLSCLPSLPPSYEIFKISWKYGHFVMKKASILFLCTPNIHDIILYIKLHTNGGYVAIPVKWEFSVS